MATAGGHRLISAGRVRTGSGVVGDSVLVDGSHVVAVGRRDELLGPGVVEVRYPNATIVPGLVDVHTHPVFLASARTTVDLHAAADLPDVIARLSDGDGPVVTGHRLDEHRLAEGRLPTRHDLDAVARPVVVHRVCGHVVVANTEALARAGVGPGTAQPPGGVIDRDVGGSPTGVLRETATALLDVLLPVDASDPASVVAALDHLRSEGLTRVGAIVDVDTASPIAPLGELSTLLSGGALPLSLHVLVATTDQAALVSAADAIAAVSDAHLRFGGLKLFSDGSFGGATAALRGGRGVGRLVPDRDLDLAQVALDLGGSVAIHAIGDAAMDATLDLFGRLVDDGADPSRLRVEHVSLTPDDVVERIAGLGVVASIQPAFVAADGPWLGGLLGDRVVDAYRFGSLADAGVPIAGGSDCPVDPSSPMWGMRWARDRGGFGDAEAVDGSTALGWWTDGAHHALGLPPPLSRGAPADLTILDHDPVDTAPGDLGGVGVVATVVGGGTRSPS